MAFKRSFSPVLDGGLVNIGDGTVRRQSVRIESGEYTPPIWLRTDAGLVVPVGSLPFRGVLDAGQLEVLSEAPSGGEPPAGVVFHSDWSTETGTTDDALLDTDKDPLAWSARKDQSPGTAIVTAASTGLVWPAGMTNVMQIWCINRASPPGGYPQGVRITDRFMPPAVGDTIWYRAYFANITPDSYSGDNSIHPWQDGPAGGNQNNWWWIVESTTSGKWRPEFHITTDDVLLGGGAQIVAWVLGPSSGGNGAILLDKGAVYGFEFGMEIVGANAWHPHARVFDVGGNILYDDSNWYRNNGNGDTLADSPTFELFSLPNTASMQLGSNGWDSPPAADFVAFYWGGMAISLNTPPGPWPIAGVED